jgi:hypothetical protein
VPGEENRKEALEEREESDSSIHDLEFEEQG